MLPEQFVEKITGLLGAEQTAFFASYDRPRNLGLRFNPLKADVFPALPFVSEPVPWEPDGRYYDPSARPGLHPWHAAGLYYLQEPSAMAPARLLNPQPGETVLDLCAAPGGKSTQLAALMRNRGILICNEIVRSRAEILSGNIERMGISCAMVTNGHPAELAGRFPAFFDRILVDAPCSGEGMFRKEEAAVTDWSPETVAMCARRQQEILCSAAEMLRPGGRLVYSTCTFSPEENEGTVNAFLNSHPEFSVEKPALALFSPGRPEWVENGSAALSDTCRLWPHKLRGEGHFAAVLRKNSAGETETADSFSAAPRRPAGKNPAEKEFHVPAELKAFLAESGIVLPEGRLITFGEHLYLLPPGAPALQGLRVLRPGLELGILRKGRFEPAHALALWLKNPAKALELPVDSAELAAYLRGETLPCRETGWIAVTAGGLTVGWGKASNGILKNHYPKGLRRV